MLRYTIKRLLQGVLTVWFIATATFVAMHNVPGDPLIHDKAVTPQIRKNLEIGVEKKKVTPADLKAVIEDLGFTVGKTA